MEYISHRGGVYTEFPPKIIKERGIARIEAFMISHECKMISCGFSNAGTLSLNIPYPPAKIPGKDDSLWDWSFFFCMVNCHSANNESERNMLNSLADEEYIKISESLIITDLDGMHYDEINIFDNTSHLDLARNAQYMAATMGVIKVPHVPKAGIMSKKSIIDNKRIDNSTLSSEITKEDLF